jgi:putative aldouronate transport system substrate-binding protein
MKKKWITKLVSATLMASMVLGMVGCGSGNAAGETQTTNSTGSDAGIQSDSPYAGRNLDLSERKTVVMYVLGDRPEDMDEVLSKANSEYFEPNLNTTLDLEFLNWSDYSTKYSLLLAGGDPVDLIYTASWCYYNEEAANGAFKALDKEWLQTYMPISYSQQPEESWDEISINGVIYAVPKSKATFTAYNEVAVRQDLIDQYQLTVPDSWDNYVSYLKELAQKQSETGVTALNTNANREQLLAVYGQSKGIQGVTEGYDFEYYANNSDAAPDADDIWYLYSSDFYKDYCLTMADLASAGVWSTDAVNDTSDAQAYFENGTSGSFVWNSSVFTAGKNMEAAGNGTYAVYDITPDVKRNRGSYSVDAIAITEKSEDPERAALVLDYMKGDVELNRLLLGGIEGVHYELDDDGNRVTLDDADGYGWNNWAWAINRQDEPDEAGIDEREVAINEHNEEMEYVPAQTGFTFDPSNVQTEYTVVQSIVDEYAMAFSLGIYGDDTEATFDSFKQQLEDAGLYTVCDEFIAQYNAYREKKGI